MKLKNFRKSLFFLLAVFILLSLTAQSYAFIRIVTIPPSDISMFCPYDTLDIYPGWRWNEIRFRVRIYFDPSVEITSIDDFSVTWSGNYFNARTFIEPLPNSAKYRPPFPKEPDYLEFTIGLRVFISNTIQDIERLGGGPFVWNLRANWTHLPLNEMLTIRLAGEGKNPHQMFRFDEKKEFRIFVNPQGRGTAPPGVGGDTAGFELRPDGTLIWRGCPSGPVTVAANVPPNGFRALTTPTGPVVIYQTRDIVRYKMYDVLNLNVSNCGPVADGPVGNGNLVDVDFDPGSYGATALITLAEGGANVFYVFKIDRWGNAGSTQRIGQAVNTRLQHWVVRWRSMIYIFEFDPQSGTLTCMSNHPNWNGRKTIDTNITGLIVPASTGGGPVVVYERNRNVKAVMLKWDTGAKIRTVPLGSGTLLGVNYVTRGSYGAEGVATIRASEKNVRFCIDLWGQYGCNMIKSTTVLPAGTLTMPDPPPGFPGGGDTPGGGADAADSDGDGFSDDYEQAAGTDPNDPNSFPAIDSSIVLLIDKSGSMRNANKMESAKKAAIDALAQIDQATEIGVMAYSGNCGERFPVIADFSQDKAYLTQQIQTIQPGGGTPMSPALLQAEEFLRNKSHGKNGLIVLLCDGQNDCPPNEADAARQIFTRTVPTKITMQPNSRRFQEKSPFKSSRSRGSMSLVPAAYAAQIDPQQQGGPDSVPPGQGQPDVIPEELVPADQTKGGAFVPPPGVNPVENLAPVVVVPAYGNTGLDTDRVSPQPQAAKPDMTIKVSTIGFGLQNDPQAQKAMADVAQAGGGQAYGAENVQQLTSAFSQAITQQPAPTGGGGGYVVGGSTEPDWELILLIFLGAGSILLILAILVVRRRRM